MPATGDRPRNGGGGIGDSPSMRRDPRARPGSGTASPLPPRAPSQTDFEVIVGSSGRGVPPTAHADARGRETHAETAHDHGRPPGPAQGDGSGRQRIGGGGGPGVGGGSLRRDGSG